MAINSLMAIVSIQEGMVRSRVLKLSAHPIPVIYQIKTFFEQKRLKSFRKFVWYIQKTKPEL
jgi:hypothetical protein